MILYQKELNACLVLDSFTYQWKLEQVKHLPL